jgi:hypothetical protein
VGVRTLSSRPPDKTGEWPDKVSGLYQRTNLAGWGGCTLALALYTM